MCTSRSARARACVRAYVSECVAACVRGCVSAWLRECVSAWLSVCVAARTIARTTSPLASSCFAGISGETAVTRSPVRFLENSAKLSIRRSARFEVSWKETPRDGSWPKRAPPSITFRNNEITGRGMT
eukprot:643109-Pleurochrysis_carterae.AAC.1